MESGLIIVLSLTSLAAIAWIFQFFFRKLKDEKDNS